MLPVPEQCDCISARDSNLSSTEGVSHGRLKTTIGDGENKNDYNPFDWAFAASSFSIGDSTTGFASSICEVPVGGENLSHVGSSAFPLDEGVESSVSVLSSTPIAFSSPSNLSRKRALSSPAIWTPGGGYSPKSTEDLTHSNRSRLTVSMSDVVNADFQLNQFTSHPSSACSISSPPKYLGRKADIRPSRSEIQISCTDDCEVKPISSIELLSQRFHQKYGVCVSKTSAFDFVNPNSFFGRHQPSLDEKASPDGCPRAFDRPVSASPDDYNQTTTSSVLPGDRYRDIILDTTLSSAIGTSSPEVEVDEGNGSKPGPTEAVQERLASAKREGTLTYQQFIFHTGRHSMEPAVGSGSNDSQMISKSENDFTSQGSESDVLLYGESPLKRRSPTEAPRRPSIAMSSSSTSSYSTSRSSSRFRSRAGSETTPGRSLSIEDLDSDPKDANQDFHLESQSLERDGRRSSWKEEKQLSPSFPTQTPSAKATKAEAPRKTKSRDNCRVRANTVSSTKAAKRSHRVAQEEESQIELLVVLDRAQKNALERNRIAAMKSRLKKKDKVSNLELKAVHYCNENRRLQAAALQLWSEVLSLRSLLTAHVGSESCICLASAAISHQDNASNGTGRQEGEQQYQTKAIGASQTATTRFDDVTREILSRDYAMIPGMGEERDCFSVSIDREGGSSVKVTRTADLIEMVGQGNLGEALATVSYHQSLESTWTSSTFDPRADYGSTTTLNSEADISLRASGGYLGPKPDTHQCEGGKGGAGEAGEAGEQPEKGKGEAGEEEKDDISMQFGNGEASLKMFPVGLPIPIRKRKH